MILINGRGKLGDALQEVKNDSDVIIYHTWEMVSDEKEDQKQSYEDFKKFVNKNKKKKIIFISTDCQQNNFYTHYKQMAESYLLQNTDDGIVLRFPAFYKKISLEDVCQTIVSYLDYNGLCRVHTIKGKLTFVGLIKEVIKKRT